MTICSRKSSRCGQDEGARGVLGRNRPRGRDATDFSSSAGRRHAVPAGRCRAVRVGRCHAGPAGRCWAGAWRGVAAAWLLGSAFPAALANTQQVLFPDAPLQPGAEAPAHPPAAWHLRQDYGLTPIPLNIRVSVPVPTQQTAADECRRGPAAVGAGQSVPAEHRGPLQDRLTWQAADDGGVSAALSISSAGAQGLRVALQASLPEGGKIRFFDPANPEPRFGPLGGEDFSPSDAEDPAAATSPRTLWSPVVAGEAIGLEVSLPLGASRQGVALELRRISVLEQAAVSPVAQPQPDNPANACTAVDVSCADAPSCADGATVRILYTEADGASFTCTAVLITDDRQTKDRLLATHLVTASHCVPSQAVAETAEVWWNYETAACGRSQQSDRFATLSGGADLLVNHARSGHSLLRLRKPVPNIALCWKAWSAGQGEVGQAVHSVHHPRGSLKEWAAGQIVQQTVTIPTANGSQEVESLVVDFHEGAPTFGSSGAGLFADEGRALIGVLAGGPPDDCSVNYYGRFDRFLSVAGSFLGAETVTPVGVADDFGDDPASATGVLLSSTTRGDLETAADVDYFRIVIQETGTLYVRTEGPSDPSGTLYYENGTVAVQDNDGGPGTNFRLVARLVAGTYYVAVRSERGTGSYSLLVDFQTERRSTYFLPLLPRAADPAQQGFVRIVNNGRTDGLVQITATDDAGAAARPIMLKLPARQTRHFNARDLELGNEQKGLSPATGAGTGDWRLELTTSLNIHAQAYARAADGIIITLQGLPSGLAKEHYVGFFNGAENTRFRSLLRLINPNERSALITIEARDDQGRAAPRGRVTLRLPRRAAMRVTAQQLEAGQPGDRDFRGRLGDGADKWQLFIKADDQIRVMNLIENQDGRLSNLSVASALGAEE